MRPRFPDVGSDYFPLGGGLDLLTPASSMEPGKLIGGVNYEPEISGGYRRIDGYERYNGEPSPSAQTYMRITTTVGARNATVGDTITDLTSGATGYCVAITDGHDFTITLIAGTYAVGNSVSDGGGTVGVITALYPEYYTDQSVHANYMNTMADTQRANIAAVPGSGRIRGVWYYNNVLYAFRDNVGATAGDMYKSTATGWTQVAFKTEIQFTNAVSQITDGLAINGATSGATATVHRAMLRSGTWTVAGVGTLIITVNSGTWQNGEPIRNGVGPTRATTSGLATAITRAVGGSMEFVNANFTGSTATEKMYGVDGVNKAFEFDGTYYIPIRTGMTTDTPTHVIAHRFYLVLSFIGSLQMSGLGQPYSWTPLTGASEIAVGDQITGFATMQGNATDTALAVFTDGRTHVLYGTSAAAFTMVSTSESIGALAFTAQDVGGDVMMLTGQGIQRFSTTQNYGNFEFGSVSHLIQPLITEKRGLQTCSTSLKTKNQYRVYFSDGTCLVVGLTGGKITGITQLDYGLTVRCMCTAVDASGTEVTWFGTDETDGYVYQDNKGTSFDGAVITAWITLPFANMESPRIRKRWRSAVLDVVSDGYAQVSATYSLGYGTSDVASGTADLSPSALTLTQGQWDVSSWDSFAWDGQVIASPRMSLDGTEKNISLTFYSSRDQDNSHTIQGVTMITSSRRIER